MRKVAIVGLGPSWKEAPWGEWEMWGIAHGEFWPRCSRIFEMHDIRLIKEHGRPGRLGNLKDAAMPVYMQEKVRNIKNSVAFPFEQTDPITRGRYCSTIDYPMSLAISEDVDTIGIWGVHLDDPKYYFQAASLNYLIGYARGAGITVQIAEASPLCRYEPISAPFGNHTAVYPARYGKL